MPGKQLLMQMQIDCLPISQSGQGEGFFDNLKVISRQEKNRVN